MADLPETLESVVRRTRGYIQLLKQENSDLLEWQERAVQGMKDAAFALETVAHLQGQEDMLLPHADNLRKLVKESQE
jgi:hypothetical protein